MSEHAQGMIFTTRVCYNELDICCVVLLMIWEYISYIYTIHMFMFVVVYHQGICRNRRRGGGGGVESK